MTFEKQLKRVFIIKISPNYLVIDLYSDLASSRFVLFIIYRVVWIEALNANTDVAFDWLNQFQ